MSRTTRFLLLLALLALGRSALAWTSVGTGIDYQRYVLTDPNNVFVTRMLISNTAATIDSTIPQGKISGATETVRSQAAKYDDSITYWGRSWGQRNDVVAAINGDFADLSQGVTNGGQIQSGWYCKSIHTDAGGATFAWTMDRVPSMGGCNLSTWDWLTVTYRASNKVQYAQGINRARAANELIIYTPQYDNTTRTDASGVEVVVEMTRPNLVLPSPDGAVGYIREVRVNAGSTPIPFDCIVLSANGSAATQLQQKATIGGEISLSQSVTSFETDCATQQPFNWKEAFAAVRGSHVLVENGTLRYYTDSLMTARHPRTAVAYNNTYVFFIVCDGRSAASRGMTGAELGAFCKDALGATWALNLDGGGSSTLVVNGSVMNTPSDGSERSVCNGLMMVNLLPQAQSTAFCAGQYVATTGSANVRLGPGTNYGVLTTASTGALGTIVNHSLRGVRAKGNYWWKLDLGGTTGWIAEGLLAASGTYQPVITSHPASRIVGAGSSPTLWVVAKGSGCLGYRWMRNNVELANGAEYSGAQSSTLTVLNCDSADTGDYSCVVYNSYGTLISDSASLDVRPPLTISISGPSPSAVRSGLTVTYAVEYANADSITLSPANIRIDRTGTATSFVSVTSSGATSRAVTLSSISGNGTLRIYIDAGTASNSYSTAPATGPSATVTVDNVPPTAVAVTDEGRWTPSLTTLRGSWTSSTDIGGSGISSYQYCVQQVGGAIIKPWVDIGSATTVVDSTLRLSEGASYRLAVRAYDRAGNGGPLSTSDAILVAAGVDKIGAIWALDNASPFALRNKVVTHASTGAFWLEEDDRSAAVKVLSSAQVGRGNRVSVAGNLGMSGAQRVLSADVIDNLGGAAEISPVGIRISDLGGRSANALTPGVTGGQATYNIGLLARCWGAVSGVSTANPTDRFFYLDDGSKLDSVLGHEGVLVRCGSANPPVSGFAVVTGIVASELLAGSVEPVLLIRDAAGIEPL